MTAKFEEAMNDDLNTSVALSVIFDLVRLAKELLEDAKTTKETLEEVDKTFRKLGGDCLGIVKEDYLQTGPDVNVIDAIVKILIEQRNEARKRKDFAAADQMRDLLDENGIVLEDKPGETVWRFK
jgi:cysteinyl-tRNA synthetase